MKKYFTSGLILSSLILITLFSFINDLQSQETSSFQLLDQDRLMPIEGATFSYDTQKGISDQNGIIRFLFLESATMHISHVSYGSWDLDANQIKMAKSEGFALKTGQQVKLYPVTVIAFRPKSDEAVSFNFNYEDKMAHDATAVLIRKPLVSSIQKSGGYGFDPVIRGFKYDQLNIVVDGAQSATAACPNRMDPPTSQIAPNMMDRIEILKGPHALRFGNAFGATINFIQSPIHFSNKTKQYGRLSGSYDSNGSIRRTEGTVGISKKHINLNLFGAYAAGDDYESGDKSLMQADFLRSSFGAKLGVKLAGNQDVALRISRNIAQDVDFAALPMDLRKDDTWMLNATHRINFNAQNFKSLNTNAFGSFVDHLMDNLLKPLDPRMMDASTLAKTRNYGIRSEGQFQFKGGLMYLGVDHRLEEAEGVRARSFLLGPNAGKTVEDNAWQHSRINKTGLFGEFHTSRGGYQFIASARLEFNNANVLDAAEEFTTVYPETSVNQINPSVSIGGIKNYENNVALGLWLGRGQRSAGLTERYINYFPVGQDPYEMLGNPNLASEVNNQIDWTLEYKTGNSRLNVDVFGSFLQDYISSQIDSSLSPRLPMSPGVRQYENIDEAFKAGFELTWNQKIVKLIDHQLSMAYTYGQDLVNQEALPEIAPFDIRYTLYGRFLSDKLMPECTFRYVFDQKRTSLAFGEAETPSFYTIDLSMDYKINRIFDVSAGVQNLLDENYYEHLSRSVRNATSSPLYAKGRNYYVTLSMNFM